MGLGFRKHLGLGFGFNSANGMSLYSPGFKIDNSFYFDGVNEYFSADAVYTNNSSDTVGTLSILYKPISATPTANETLLSFADTSANEYLGLFHLSTGKIAFQSVKAGVTQFNIHSTNIPFTVGEWCKIDIVQNGTRPIMYFNNVAIAMTDINATDLTSWLSDLTNIDNFNIGTMDYNAGGDQLHLNGYISQVAYLNTNISQAQITDWYNNGQPKNAQNLFGTNCKYFFNPDNRTGDTAQFTVEDSTNSINATSVSMEDADLSPLTPYTDQFQKIYDKYGSLAMWSFENVGINGTTTTLYDYAGTHDLSNPAVANQPTFYGADGNLNNLPSAYFVTDDYNYKAVANWLSGQTTGAIHCAFRTGADVTSTNVIFGSSDELTANQYFAFFIVGGVMKVYFRNSLTVSDRYELECDTTTITANTNYIVSAYQNGSEIQILINGVDQTLTVANGTATNYWISDIDNRDNISIGAVVKSSIIYSDADIGLVQVTSDSADTTVLNNHTDINDLYGCYLTAEAPLSIEKSFYFDGVDEYFSADSLLSNVSSDTAGTISVLVKSAEIIPANNARIVSFGDTNANTRINITQNASTGVITLSSLLSGAIQFSISTTAAVDLTDWTLITCVQDSVNPIIYINGVEVAQTTNVSTDLTVWLNGLAGMDNFTIASAKYNSTIEYNFNGYISQVSYVNTNMSAQDVAYIYNNGNVRNVQTLLGAKCKFFFNPDNRTGDTAQFTVTDSINSINAVSVNMENEDLSPLTPYDDPIADLVSKYGFINAWSGENIGINGTTTTVNDYLLEHDMSNPAVANQPTFTGGDADFNNRPTLTFATDDYLYKAVSNYRSTDTSGCIVMVIDDTSTGFRVGLVKSNQASSTNQIFGSSGNKPDFSTTFATSTNGSTVNANAKIVAILNTGSENMTFTNGVNDTDINNDKWTNDLATTTEITIGGILRASGDLFYDGRVAFVGYLPYTDEATIVALQNELKTIFGI